MSDMAESNSDAGKAHHYKSSDGLSLYYREYGANNTDSFPVLCMHGLTRNSKDFVLMAEYLSPHYRLIVPDIRGRGQSEYDPDYNNYSPKRYIDDMWELLDHLEIEKFIIIGTSMGGLMGMLMAASTSDRVLGLVMNDVGPEVEQEGLEKIKAYTGKMPTFSDWESVVVRIKKINQATFPTLTEQEWLSFVKCLFIETDSGEIIGDYDPHISQMFRSEQPDLWDFFEKCVDTPILLIHGELSDLLSDRIIERMKRIKPDLVVAKVPNRGHAPLLNESEVQSALSVFLSGLDKP